MAKTFAAKSKSNSTKGAGQGARHGARNGARPETQERLPTLDLHGFKTDAVQDAVDRFLMKSQSAGHPRIRLITGKGTGAVRTVALDWLKKGGFPFKQENEGSFLIFLD